MTALDLQTDTLLPISYELESIEERAKTLQAGAFLRLVNKTAKKGMELQRQNSADVVTLQTCDRQAQTA